MIFGFGLGLDWNSGSGSDRFGARLRFLCLLSVELAMVDSLHSVGTVIEVLVGSSGSSPEIERVGSLVSATRGAEGFMFSFSRMGRRVVTMFSISVKSCLML